MTYVFHTPVLLSETLHYLNPQSAGIYIDGTVGGAGHAEEILHRLTAKGKLICIDADEDAIQFAKKRLGRFGKQVALVHENYHNLKAVLRSLNVEAVDGLLLDLGVSTAQLENPSRGFSYLRDERLDMRMDQRQKLDAWFVVNRYTEKELAEIFWKLGEERHARAIAKRIISARRNQPIETTGELMEIVQSVARRQYLMKSLARVFQAIRIEVNRELENLKKVLEDGTECLRVGGRLVVISYHSLEDRIVKNFFRGEAAEAIPSGSKFMPDRVRRPRLAVLTRKPVVASKEEVERNPRARSAKLRAAERIG